MDTGLLRGFAGSARVALLAGVASRVGVVLAAGSDARAVVRELVAGLKREVAAAGGGEAGRQAVVDRVAYTWFNRITALRFLDAAGITTMKVVSPVPGGVQPEVLTAAKQGVRCFASRWWKSATGPSNTLQPLADKQLEIDLDDGVKRNYPLLGAALKKIPRLDTPNE